MRRCVALLVTSLAKPREGKVIFSAVKAFRVCFPTAIRSSARNSEKIFPHQSQAYCCDLLFCPAALLDKIKDRSAASSVSRVFASTEKQDDTSFAKI
jgi:hypothetical protein